MHKKSLEAAAHLESVEGEEFDDDEDPDEAKKLLISKHGISFENLKLRDEFSEDETLKSNTAINRNNSGGRGGIKNELIRASPIVQKLTASLTSCNSHLQNINHVGYQFHYNS